MFRPTRLEVARRGSGFRRDPREKVLRITCLANEVCRPPHGARAATPAIHAREEHRQRPRRAVTREYCASADVLKPQRKAPIIVHSEVRVLEILADHAKAAAIVAEHRCHEHSTAEALGEENEPHRRQEQNGAARNGSDDDTRANSGCNRSTRDRRRARTNHHAALEPAGEDAAVAPCSEFRPQRRADSNQLRAVSEGGKPDVVRLRPKPPRAKSPFALLDCFPSLFDRSEIPARTVRAHDPEATFGGIEREPAADGKCLDRVVAAEGPMAVQARGVHGAVNMNRCEHR